MNGLQATPQATEAQSLFVSAPDGLSLHVRRYGPRHATSLPVICLPGLSRTEEDFAALASFLSSEAGGRRRVFAPDYRGRGHSAYDSDWRRYSLEVELYDLLAVLTALELHRCIFIGTSRGGLLTMLLAAVRPTAIAGAVLNDIGPVIEIEGLLRIKSYIGKLPVPADHDEGAATLKQVHGAQFPNLTSDDWRAWSRRSWRQNADDAWAGRYDPALARTLEPVNAADPLPALWAQFEALAHVPVMAIRGGLTDLLSAETFSKMKARHTGLDALEIPDQGHAPLLNDVLTMQRIAAFVAGCGGAA